MAALLAGAGARRNFDGDVIGSQIWHGVRGPRAGFVFRIKFDSHRPPFILVGQYYG